MRVREKRECIGGQSEKRGGIEGYGTIEEVCVCVEVRGNVSQIWRCVTCKGKAYVSLMGCHLCVTHRYIKTVTYCLKVQGGKKCLCTSV